MAAATAAACAVVVPPAAAQEGDGDGSAGAAPAAACGTAFPDYRPDPLGGSARTLAEQEIVMSDGVVLRAQVLLPPGGSGPYPTALTITGYNKNAIGGTAFGSGAELWRHGYAVVVVDDRGTGTSGGAWTSWDERTQADYPEVLDWIVEQAWSNGDVGVFGGSYMGITALFTAATGHPAVKAVFAMVPMGDAYRDIVFAGGEANAAFIPLWLGLVTGLGLIPGGDPTSIIDHLLAAPDFQVESVLGALVGDEKAYDGPFWRQRSPIDVTPQIQVPTFIVGGLDDLFQRGEPMLYEALAGHTDARLLIGPWGHINTGAGLPRDGVPSAGDLTIQWFDAYVKGIEGTGVECVPQVTQYVRGLERYQSAPTWPIPDLTARRWFLRGDGSLTADRPSGAEAGRSYMQLPITGLCTRSASQWLAGALAGTPCDTDNSLDETLSLTYTTAPFTETSRIDGPIQADLWLRAELGTEAMVSVAVSSVSPSGTSRGLSNGMLLASHRAVDEGRSRMLDGQSIQPWHPFTEAAQQAVVPGEAMLVPVEVFPTSAVIPKGHRLRVTVAAYDVPHALPPLPNVLSTLAGPVTVLNDAAHPSSVVLPVVAARDATPAVVTDPAGDPASDGAAAAGSGRLPATGGTLAPTAATVVLLLAALALRRSLAG